MSEMVGRLRSGAERRVSPKRRSSADGEQLELKSSGPGRFERRWSAAAVILLCSILAVLFVANAIRVNELMTTITTLEAERDDARRANEGLRAELTRLMSVEQVLHRAGELGMVEPAEPPVAIGGDAIDQGEK